MKILTLKHTGYTIKGVADLTLWGGGNGCIDMKKFMTTDISKKTLLQGINDNGFGVEKINGAICDIYENYEGTLRFLKFIVVGKVSINTEKYYSETYSG